MPITDTSMYRTREDILSEMLTSLVAAISDAYTGEDGITRILFEIEAAQLENLYLAHQLLLEDAFVTTASAAALERYGEEYALPMKIGTPSVGTLIFEGAGGTYIPIGTEVGYDPGQGMDVLYFLTTVDGIIPDPGIAVAPTAAIQATAGNLNGLYEYAVSFVTATGETLRGASAMAISPVNQQGNVTLIPLGGPGTISRRLYRDKNGSGTYRRVIEIADNTTTSYIDNITDAVVAANPVAATVDMAHQMTVYGQSEGVGVENNVGVGTITELTNAPSPLTGVVNGTTFTGATDVEDTEEYRQRLLDLIQSPGTGSPSDLESWAESVPGVGSATAFPNTPANGSVTVRISGPNGTVPSSDVIATVQSTLQSLDLANITIIVTTFTPVSTNVTVDVTTSGTYALGDVTSSVQQAVADYITSLDVGGTLMISGIIDSVFGLPGISDVTVTSPTTNQTTAATDKRIPGTITVT